jgi:hypothetical protein
VVTPPGSDGENVTVQVSVAVGAAPESGPITTGDPSVIKDPNRWLIRSPREYG